MKLMLWFALALLACPVVAEIKPVEKHDYAYGLPIEVSGEASIYRLSVPEVVYTHLVRADYGDLRVFNAAGEVVPHSLRRPVDASADAGARWCCRFFHIR